MIRNDFLIGGAAENIVLARTFTVSGDNLSASSDQHIFVKAGATSPEVVAAAAGDPVLGVSQDTAKTGEGISVGMVGITQLTIGGAVTFGERLKADASGRAVRHLGLGAYGAIALQDGGSANEKIEALLVPGGFATSA